MHRETEQPIAIERREDASTIEMEEVRVRSIRISSRRPVEAMEARVPQ